MPTDKTIFVGDKFNPMDGSKANDDEDSSLTSKIKVRRVLVIVATPDLPQGGSGDQKPPKRRPWRGTPLGVQRRRISDEEADVRGETRRVRAPAGRGRHELHPGRARGRRLETHRQGVAQREPRHRDHEPYRARQKAADRLKRPKPRKAAEGTPLWAEILAGLRRHWSPERIANRPRLDLPDNGDMHASVETICQAIYLQARGELKQEPKRAMRQGRTARRPQGGQGRKPRSREPMAMISERPPEIEDRAVPGHWEGDLITGSRNKSAIGTLVERTTRFTILPHLPDGHDAEHARQAIIDKMQHLPRLLRNSLTRDQGAEPALRKRIGASPDMAVCFCDPRSPWQRGANENTNGLLRQYFPKGTDLSVYPEDHLDAVAEELNDRPRKTLGFMKPSEKIIELLDAA